MYVKHWSTDLFGQSVHNQVALVDRLLQKYNFMDFWSVKWLQKVQNNWW